MSRLPILFVSGLLLTFLIPAGVRAQQETEAEVRALIQAQADAFNRGDLDGTMATLSRDVDWRTIGRQMIQGHEAVRAAMRGWIDGQQANGARLFYPPDSVSVVVHSPDEAVADVVLIWQDARAGEGPRRRESVENLFFVLKREGGRLVIRHVRNTTTCPPRQTCG